MARSPARPKRRSKPELTPTELLHGLTRKELLLKDGRYLIAYARATRANKDA